MFEAKDVKRGLKYYDQWGEFKVMAVADGYYMCRRPRCIPTIFAVKDLVNAINGERLSLVERVKGITIPSRI